MAVNALVDSFATIRESVALKGLKLKLVVYLLWICCTTILQ